MKQVLHAGSDIGDENDENEEEEWKYMELEDKKILNKRKKRVEKIEDVVYDLQQFFKTKKRFKPSSNESTYDSEK